MIPTRPIYIIDKLGAPSLDVRYKYRLLKDAEYALAQTYGTVAQAAITAEDSFQSLIESIRSSIFKALLIQKGKL